MRGVFIFLLASCDSVFGLQGRAEPDAFVPPAETCGADSRYVPIADTPSRSTYRIVDMNRVSWAMAFQDCRDDSMTGITHLIVFDDLAELASIRAVSPTRPNATWYAWGGYARDYEGPAFEFTAVTGQPLSSTSVLWAANEPDNGGDPTKTNPEPMPETVVWWGDNSPGLIDGPWDWNGPEGYVCECDGQPTIGIEFDIRPPP